ncbi:MAG: hypothetical protein KF829_09635 [Ferruginibacter sp.]|nr:hypothetical protein [Ferruginibacter sp.]
MKTRLFFLLTSLLILGALNVEGQSISNTRNNKSSSKTSAPNKQTREELNSQPLPPKSTNATSKNSKLKKKIRGNRENTLNQQSYPSIEVDKTNNTPNPQPFTPEYDGRKKKSHNTQPLPPKSTKENSLENK